MLGHGGFVKFHLLKRPWEGKAPCVAPALGHRDVYGGFVSSLLMSCHWPEQVFHVGFLHPPVLNSGHTAS